MSGLLELLPYLVAAVALLAAGAGALWSARLARLLRDAEERERRLVAELRGELGQVAAQGLRVANLQRTIARELELLAERQGRLELRGDGRPFEAAISMLRSGATSAELVSRLGLSEVEASLLARLHGGQASGPPQAQA